ncbi:MAG: hypothetical protein AAF717_07640 [Bacteroidota bacterium]
MSGLAVMYSKEIAKELTKIAVVLPGEALEVGQVIHFPFGRKGVWPFRKPAPRGSFNIITSLDKLGIKITKSKWKKESDPYIFASRKSVKIDANFGAQGNIDPNVNAAGNLKASFEKEGAVYFAAIDCERTDLLDLQNVQIDLEKHKNEIIWNETFLVTSITRANRALIMQSSTNSANLNITGDVKGLITKSQGDISANAKIGVENFKESSFIKPWSENVTVFMGLHRFTKKSFGFTPSVETMSRSAPFEELEVKAIAGELVNSKDDVFALEEVSAFEILDDEDFKEML